MRSWSTPFCSSTGTGRSRPMLLPDSCCAPLQHTHTHKEESECHAEWCRQMNCWGLQRAPLDSQPAGRLPWGCADALGTHIAKQGLPAHAWSRHLQAAKYAGAATG